MAFNQLRGAADQDIGVDILQVDHTAQLQINQSPLEFSFNRSVGVQHRGAEDEDEQSNLNEAESAHAIEEEDNSTIAQRIMLQSSDAQEIIDINSNTDELFNNNQQNELSLMNSTEYFCMLNEQLKLLKRKEKQDNLKKRKRHQQQQIGAEKPLIFAHGQTSTQQHKRLKNQRRQSMEIDSIKNGGYSPAGTRQLQGPPKLEEQSSTDQQRTLTLKSSLESSEKSDSSFPRHCRICYAGEFTTLQGSSDPPSNSSSDQNSGSQRDGSNPDLNQPPLIKKEKLLQQICKCKGSMKFVHESCLVKWLQTQSLNLQDRDKRRCELCLCEYKITYEFDSISNIVKKGFNYAIKDKKRLIRGLLYMLYLYIFFKRFTHMIRSLMRFTLRMMLYGYRGVRNLGIRKGTQMIQVSKKTADQSVTNLLLPNLHQTLTHDAAQQSTRMVGTLAKTPMNRTPYKGARLNLIYNKMIRLLSISRMVTTFIRVIGFLYRLFIFNQMCILFYGEAIRLKKYLNFLIANSKKMTFKQYKDTESS